MTLPIRGSMRVATPKILRAVRALAWISLAVLGGAGVRGVYAAPSIKAGSEAQNDGPIKYTVAIDSKMFGRERATRTIRSGQSDDFTWQEAAPRVLQSVPDACPGASNIPRSGDGSPVRQVQVRLTPVVGPSGNANVQLLFRGYVPRGTKAVTVAGQTLQCPAGTSHEEIRRFSMSTATGANKTITLGDGSTLKISVSRK
ncbi:hypothetical protein BURK_008586 [Burkholderia sp. SJ98]|nr:hypothetical protein BURK_008586 [Burkholderia sp. SJ98]